MGRPDPQLRDAILAHLRQHHASMCRHWFDEIEPVELSGGTLKLLVREQVQLKYLQRCCVKQFTDAAQAATDRLLAVRFVGEADLGDHSEDETFEASLVLMKLLDEEIDGRGVVVFHPTTGGIDEEFFGDTAVEIIAALVGEDGLETRDVIKLFARDELAAGVDFLSVFFGAVLSDGIEVF